MNAVAYFLPTSWAHVRSWDCKRHFIPIKTQHKWDTWLPLFDVFWLAINAGSLTYEVHIFCSEAYSLIFTTHSQNPIQRHALSVVVNTVHSRAAMLRACLVKVYWSCVEPYCSSSPSHRWRLEAYSGWLSPPASMWWTLNYLADRSYLPPAHNRSFCQVLTSTSCQRTHHLRAQIYARGACSTQTAKFVRQRSVAGASVNWNV